MVTIKDLSVRQGETHKYDVYLKDVQEVDGFKVEVPVDISRFRGRGWIVKKASDQRPSCRLVVDVVNGVEGHYRVTVPATETEKLTLRAVRYSDINEYQYDVELYNPLLDNDVIRVLQGKMLVSPECTKFADDDPPIPANTYVVTFDSQGGSPVSSITVDEGRTIEKPTDPVLDDHTFGGWAFDSAGSIPFYFVYPIMQDTGLFAIWNAIVFVFSFDSNGGSSVADIYVNSGDLVPEPVEPTKDNFLFDFWYSDEALTETWDFATDTADKDTELYAGWEAVSGGNGQALTTVDGDDPVSIGNNEIVYKNNDDGFLYRKSIKDTDTGTAITSVASSSPEYIGDDKIVYKNTSDGFLYLKDLSVAGNGTAITSVESASPSFVDEGQLVYVNVTEGNKLYLKSATESGNGTPITDAFSSSPVYVGSNKLVYTQGATGYLYLKDVDILSEGTAITSVEASESTYIGNNQLVYRNLTDGFLYLKSSTEEGTGTALNSVDSRNPCYVGSNILVYRNDFESLLYMKTI